MFQSLLVRRGSRTLRTRRTTHFRLLIVYNRNHFIRRKFTRDYGVPRLRPLGEESKEARDPNLLDIHPTLQYILRLDLLHALGAGFKTSDHRLCVPCNVCHTARRTNYGVQILEERRWPLGRGANRIRLIVRRGTRDPREGQEKK